MSYQVIARKYRPQRFEDVVGQDHVTRTLANAITQNRIAHAYLFVGPRGTGKTTLARIFAKCLNCQDGPSVTFADDDPLALEIAEGRSMDVLEIDGASNRGIDEIRDLRETVKYAPANSRFKIYIIDEVHMLTKEAFNALLKTLEEPPAHVKFMFATTEPEKVLATILSRCQRFDLRRIPSALIVKHLRYIAQQEGVGIDDGALHAIARGADGGMRDAESTLDQLISFCGNEIAADEVLSMFGLAAREQIVEMGGAILDGDAERILSLLHELTSSGKELGRLVGDLLSYFRSLMMLLISQGDAALRELSEAELQGLREQAERTNRAALTRILSILTDCEARLRGATSRRIVMEVALLQAAEATYVVPVDRLIERLEGLRSGASAGDSPAATSEEASGESGVGSKAADSAKPKSGSRGKLKTAAPERSRGREAEEGNASAHEGRSAVDASNLKATAATAATANEPADLLTLWPSVCQAVGAKSPFVQSYLREAFPLSVEGDVLTIGFLEDSEDRMSLVDNPKSREMIAHGASEIVGRRVDVRLVHSAPPAGWVAPAAPDAGSEEPNFDSAGAARKSSSVATASSKEAQADARSEPPKPRRLSPDEFKNDPLIQDALRIFKGQIVDVRK